MSASHFADVVCVCTLEENAGTSLEEAHGWWRGWAVYHMHHDERAASSALSAVLRPLALLQSHAHTALTNATLLLAEVNNNHHHYYLHIITFYLSLDQCIFKFKIPYHTNTIQVNRIVSIIHFVLLLPIPCTACDATL